MKSAYELAMERLAKNQPETKLTDAQKQELADINARYEARLAERKTFLNGKIKEAEAKGDLPEADQFRTQLRRDVATLNEEMEAKKEAVRKK
ncbi:MAG: hypothetical protein LBH01_03590 [Verrucomicrobiales bacterium]|jgi:hypothetical protein|nr:hypothetical protein [Verrucomicrobiales bacterium]